MTAVYSCVRVLAETLAGLPLHLYKRGELNSKEKAKEYAIYFLLHDEPNVEMTSFVFRETLMTHLLLWGNSYAQIIRNGRNEVIGLYPLMPNKMTVMRSEDGIRYKGLSEGEDASFFLCKELLPGYLDGITGEYETPKGYYVDELAAEVFDKTFPYKDKLEHPGQLF